MSDFNATVEALLGAALQRRVSRPIAPDPEELIASALSRYKVHKLLPKAETGGGGGSSSSSGTRLQTKFQELVDKGMTTKEAAKQVQELVNAREQVKIAKNPKKLKMGFGLPMDLAKKLPGMIGRGALSAGEQALKGLSRPGTAITTAMYGQAKDVKDLFTGEFKPSELYDVAKGGVAGAVLRAPEMKRGFMLEKDKSHTGSDVLDVLGWDTKGEKKGYNDVAHALGGFALDVAADPFSYLSLGTTGLVGKTGEELAEAGIKGAAKKSALKQVKEVVRTVSTGAASKSKKLAAGEADAIAARVAEEFRPLVEAGVQSAKPAHKFTGDRTLQNLIRTAKNHANPQVGLDDVMHQFSVDIADALGKSAGKGAAQVKFGFLGHGSTDILKNTKWAEGLYKPLEYASGKLSNVFPTKVLQNHFSMEHLFPGLTGRLRASTASKGYHAFMGKRKEILDLFRHTSKTERREMLVKIEEGGRFLDELKDKNGTPLNEILDKAKVMFKDIFDEEVSLGIRNKNEEFDHYVYHQFKKPWKASDKVDQWRARRTDAFKKVKGATAKDMHLTAEDAKAFTGLDVHDDIAESLLGRYAKHNRDAVRQWYRNEVLNTYGTFVRENEKRAYSSIGGRDLQKVSKENLTKMAKQTAKDEAGAWYLPKDIHDTFKHVNGLQKQNNPAVAQAFRWLDTFNRHFKFAATVPNPGYHFRNMIGDAMFSKLDNGEINDYGKIFGAWRKLRKGDVDYAFKTHGGNSVKYNDLIQGYLDRTGVGGFYPTEVPQGIANPLSWKSRTGAKMRTGAEMREEWGRLAHFKSAYEQELKPLLKNGEAFEDASKKAMDAAADRVNKFNFDYHATTPVENDVIKRIIPFYTFQRKAFPLILEQMATNPGRLMIPSKFVNAFQEALGVEGTMPFADFGIPDYLNMPGLMRTNNEAEPSFITGGDFNPTSAMMNLFGGTKDPQLALKSGLSKLNPGIRLPFELATGRSFFSGRPIDSSVEAILGEVDPTRQFRGAIDAEAKAQSGTETRERLLRYLGVPIHRATSERQTGTVKAKAERWKKQLEPFNKALEDRGYEFVTSTKNGKKVFRIVDRTNGSVLYESDDASEVREAANALYP